MSDSNSTTYKVSTVFEASDKASSKIDEIGKSASKASHATGELANTLKGLAVSFGVYKGFELAKHAIFGANAELEQHKIKLAGLTSMYSGIGIDRAWSRAELSMKRFTEMSWKSGAPVMDLVKSAEMLQGPLLQARMTVTQIEKMVHSSAAAAGAFGKESTEVASGVMRAIMIGKVSKDIFVRSLLSQSGIDVSAEKFGKMKMSERAGVMQRALDSKGVNSFVERQGSTFSGAIGNIKSHLEKLAETAGEPLFKAATAELVKWQGWIEKNRGSLESAGHKVGEYLITAFNAVKEIGVSLFPIIKDVAGVLRDAIAFVANNKDVVMGVAKALLAMKVGEKIGSIARGAAGGVGGFFGGMGDNFSKVKEGFVGLKDGTGLLGAAFSNMSSILSGAGGLIGGLAKAATVAWALGKIVFGDNEKDKKVLLDSAERKKAADDYNKNKSELARYEKMFGPGQLNFDPAKEEIKNESLKADYERLKELRAGKEASQENVLKEMIKQGTIRSTIKDGKEHLELTSSDKTLEYSKHFEEDIATRTALVNAADQMWKEMGGIIVNRGTNVRGWLDRDLVGAKASEEDPDKGIQAKPPEQNITINIQQVMAKDPNRWLADMDDMVNRRNRAPTRSKRSWKSSPQ